MEVNDTNSVHHVLLQIGQSLWTSRSPVNLQRFNLTDHQNVHMLHSWQMYKKFLNLYNIFLKAKPVTLRRFGLEHILWENENTHYIKQWRHNIRKMRYIQQYLTPESDNPFHECVLMLVWNKYYPKWIRIPCNETIIDKASLFCVNNTPDKKFDLYPNITEVRKLDFGIEMTTLKINSTFVCNDFSLIFSGVLCDGHWDCNEGEDEKICSSRIFNTLLSEILSTNFRICGTSGDLATKANCRYDHKHFIKNYIYNNSNLAHEGVKIKCKYDIIKDKENRRIVNYCSEGSHLEFCENISCVDMFKCPGYYCLPWRLVCDGHWDCPLGNDETNCDFMNRPGFYHCANSSINILPQSICDGVWDCNDGTDEYLCDFHKIQCPLECHCVTINMYCTNLFLNLFTNTFYTLPHIYLHITQTDTIDKINLFLLNLPRVAHVIFTNNTFKEFCLSHRQLHISITFLSMQEGNISTLKDNCLSAVPSLLHLLLNHNQISKVSSRAFQGVSQTKTISLKANNINKLQRYMFANLHRLILLDISDNHLTVVHQDIFTKSLVNGRVHVKSTSCIFCCFPIRVTCIIEKSCILPCNRMLIDFSAVVVGILNSFLGFLLNFIILFIMGLKKQSHNSVKYCFKVISEYITLFHCINSITMALNVTADIHFSVNFVFIEYEWPKNTLCLSIYFLTVISYMINAFLIFLITLARLMIVYFPLKTNFKNNTFVKKLLSAALLTILFLAISLTHHRYKYFKDTKNRLCSPLDNKLAANLSLLVSSILIISIGLISVFCVLIFYILLTIELKKPLHIGTEKLSKPVVLHIVLACGSHICTWVPMCIVLLLSLFSYDMSERILVWTVVAIIPINSLIYPILLR